VLPRKLHKCHFIAYDVKELTTLKSVGHVKRLPNVSVEDKVMQSGMVPQLTIATVQTYCDVRQNVTHWDTNGDSL